MLERPSSLNSSFCLDAAFVLSALTLGRMYFFLTTGFVDPFYYDVNDF